MAVKIPILKNRSDARELLVQKLRAVIPAPCERILLIHPPHIPEEDFLLDRALNNRYWSYQPYGAGVLCRDLEARGYTTDILDLNYEILAGAHAQRKDFRYSSWRDFLKEKLESFRPDLVGLSCMFTMSHGSVRLITEAVKSYCKSIPIIGGGVHLSNARKLALEDCPHLDFIGVYECDKSFPDLIDFINGRLAVEHLTQLATLIDGEYVAIEDRSTPDATEIEATPLYHILPIGNYNEVGQIGTYGFLRKGRKAASVLSNRGCRAHCSFCSVVSFNGPGVRERSVESVVDEIQELQERYGIQHITWLNDDLLFNRKRALALFNEITRRNLGITWDASNGLIAAFITPDLMRAMVESGCIGFNLGIESGNPDILRAVHKPGTPDSFRKAKVIIDQYPQIFVKGFLIIGFPNETLRQILDTVSLSLELCFDWYPVQLLNPLPNTEIYYQMIEQGLIQDNLETSNVAYVFGPHGRQRLREQREKLSAQDFFDLFNVCDLDSIPSPEHLGDYWFLVDYKVNYEIILGLRDPIKIRKKNLMLEDTAHRIAPENPMAHLFYGITEKKLSGDSDSIRIAAGTAEILVRESNYWQKRFEALDLYVLLEELKTAAA